MRNCFQLSTSSEFLQNGYSGVWRRWTPPTSFPAALSLFPPGSLSPSIKHHLSKAHILTASRISEGSLWVSEHNTYNQREKAISADTRHVDWRPQLTCQNQLPWSRKRLVRRSSTVILVCAKSSMKAITPVENTTKTRSLCTKMSNISRPWMWL